MEEQKTETQETTSSKNANSGIVWTILIVLILIATGAYFFRHSLKSMVMGSSTKASVSITTKLSPSVSPAEKVFTVTGGEFYFKPNTLTVKKGQKIKIVFQNTGGFHDFVIDEFNVKTDRIGSGESATAEFVADKTGTFTYYCSVGKHKQLGMYGTLTVE